MRNQVPNTHRKPHHAGKGAHVRNLSHAPISDRLAILDALCSEAVVERGRRNHLRQVAADRQEKREIRLSSLRTQGVAL